MNLIQKINQSMLLEINCGNLAKIVCLLVPNITLSKYSHLSLIRYLGKTYKRDKISADN